jgi:hypothetical protein
LVKSNASTPLVLRTISLSLSYFCCLRLHTLLLTLSYTTLLVTSVCMIKTLLSFSAHHPYYPHHPRVAKPTYLVYLATFIDTPNRLPLGKYKFDTRYSPSEVLHDSSVHLRNPLSYIHTYESSSTSISIAIAGYTPSSDVKKHQQQPHHRCGWCGLARLQAPPMYNNGVCKHHVVRGMQT